ncbi:MAG: guanylate kinase [Phycisphaeraceae bacterium]|nr:guanylate kinase [Phycisphaeraceae bacterium]
MSNPGLLLVICGPSGVGKTTITGQVRKILSALFSVSMTTRPRTAADTDGVDYHFVDIPTFQKARDEGKLLEWAEVFGNFYGTPREPVDQAVKDGRVMILEIDVQGAIQVKKLFPAAFSLFVLPPSEDELLRRLRKRQREDEATIQRRFRKAKDEIAMAKACGVYDVFLVNDDLDQAIAEAVRIVREELTKRQAATGA